jgi:hypothetical protein
MKYHFKLFCFGLEVSLVTLIIWVLTFILAVFVIVFVYPLRNFESENAINVCEKVCGFCESFLAYIENYQEYAKTELAKIEREK